MSTQKSWKLRFNQFPYTNMTTTTEKLWNCFQWSPMILWCRRFMKIVTFYQQKHRHKFCVKWMELFAYVNNMNCIDSSSNLVFASSQVAKKTCFAAKCFMVLQRSSFAGGFSFIENIYFQHEWLSPVVHLAQFSID